MQRIHHPSDMSAVSKQLHTQGKTIGLVPTMGNLHAGHLSLVRRIKPHVDTVIVSIFVNPTQFGPHEDFSKYPRTLEQDCAQLKEHAVDYVFAPDAASMYVGDTFVNVPGLSDTLCGASRPGHFQGVATIVCKLLQLTQADTAIFGEKDFQQLMVIRRMVNDLCLPTTIISGPIVREENGLAMSSRNQYLSDGQREQAAELYRTLNTLTKQAAHTHDYEKLIQDSTAYLNHHGFKTDYIAIRRQKDLQPPTPEDKNLVVLAAAYLGNTRLIDNIAFEV